MDHQADVPGRQVGVGQPRTRTASRASVRREVAPVHGCHPHPDDAHLLRHCDLISWPWTWSPGASPLPASCLADDADGHGGMVPGSPEGSPDAGPGRWGARRLRAMTEPITR